MMTDPIADMLARIRNANKAMHEHVSMPSSRQKIEIARLLKEEGYINGYRVERRPDDAFDTLVIELKFGRNRERKEPGSPGFCSRGRLAPESLLRPPPPRKTAQREGRKSPAPRQRGVCAGAWATKALKRRGTAVSRRASGFAGLAVAFAPTRANRAVSPRESRVPSGARSRAAVASGSRVMRAQGGGCVDSRDRTTTRVHRRVILAASRAASQASRGFASAQDHRDGCRAQIRDRSSLARVGARRF